MSLNGGEKSFKMKMRDVETAFKYRRIPYPKRSVELIALLAISCTFFLFMHTNKLNSRLKEMEVKLQPSEFSALGLTGNHISGRDGSKHDDINTLHGTYQYLKSTGQKRSQERRSHDKEELRNTDDIHSHKDNKHYQIKGPQHERDSTSDNPPVDRNHKNSHGKSRNSEDYDLNDLKKDYDLMEDYNYDDYEYFDDDEINLKADLLNNTKRAEVDVLFFNRVPKVGSQSLMQLMGRLSNINGFTHSNKGAPHEIILLGPPKQKKFIEELLTKDRPHVYSQHMAYINFTRFHMPRPIYVNLIRDPIERIISWHYYIRTPKYYADLAKVKGAARPTPSDDFMAMDLDTCVKTKDKHCQFNQMDIKNPVGDHRRQTLFFCGQNRKLCMPFNSKAAMQKAKRTVEEDYAVVGTWEHTNITLTVLEHYIPKFFKHAKVAYYLGEAHLANVNRNFLKKPLSDETREILRKNMTMEIEFYEFCKQRLFLQYTAISGGNKIDNDDYVLIPEQNDKDEEEF